MLSILKKLFGPAKSSAVILMYHRIAEAASDPWDLCVSPANFEAHVQAVKARYRVLHTYRISERIREDISLADVVAITFDDGYLDNFTNARPILEKYNVPATFFITAKFRSDNKFWWDELEQLILHTPKLPEAVNFQLNGRDFKLMLGDTCELDATIRQQNKSWRYGQPFPNARIKLYYELWVELKTMSMEEQRKALNQIKNWAGAGMILTPPLMNETQIKELTAKGLFEIGGHSVNHPALGVLSSADQHFEIKKSKDELENVVAQTLKGFAYPYGHYNAETPVLTKSAGFSYAVTTSETVVTRDDSLYELSRFQVKDVDAQTLIDQIESWKKK